MNEVVARPGTRRARRRRHRRVRHAAGALRLVRRLRAQGPGVPPLPLRRDRRPRGLRHDDADDLPRRGGLRAAHADGPPACGRSARRSPSSARSATPRATSAVHYLKLALLVGLLGGVSASGWASTSRARCSRCTGSSSPSPCWSSASTRSPFRRGSDQPAVRRRRRLGRRAGRRTARARGGHAAGGAAPSTGGPCSSVPSSGPRLGFVPRMVLRRLSRAKVRAAVTVFGRGPLGVDPGPHLLLLRRHVRAHGHAVQARGAAGRPRGVPRRTQSPARSTRCGGWRACARPNPSWPCP